MSEPAQLVGINHVALEVGDIDQALDFYGRLFAFQLRGRSGDRMAFIDAADQFIALSAPRRQPPDDSRHFGLVVDDARAVRDALEREGVEILPGRGLDFRDPWGNRVQVVQYDEIQFTKSEPALRALGRKELGKTPKAEAEMREKGLLD
ncbi:MAG TPA: VOC family protein [Solirubrobacterales bacterium]|jgi:catechol 2,3-dioxygenase-like lactoylglutathione lyase family enzyme